MIINRHIECVLEAKTYEERYEMMKRTNFSIFNNYMISACDSEYNSEIQFIDQFRGNGRKLSSKNGRTIDKQYNYVYGLDSKIYDRLKLRNFINLPQKPYEIKYYSDYSMFNCSYSEIKPERKIKYQGELKPIIQNDKFLVVSSEILNLFDYKSSKKIYITNNDITKDYYVLELSSANDYVNAGLSVYKVESILVKYFVYCVCVDNIEERCFEVGLNCESVKSYIVSNELATKLVELGIDVEICQHRFYTTHQYFENMFSIKYFSKQLIKKVETSPVIEQKNYSFSNYSILIAEIVGVIALVFSSIWIPYRFLVELDLEINDLVVLAVFLVLYYRFYISLYRFLFEYSNIKFIKYDKKNQEIVINKFRRYKILNDKKINFVAPTIVALERVVDISDGDLLFYITANKPLFPLESESLIDTQKSYNSIYHGFLESI